MAAAMIAVTASKPLARASTPRGRRARALAECLPLSPVKRPSPILVAARLVHAAAV
jgi:hypothetical protein